LRRERERRAVLEEVVRQMRRRGKLEFGMADIFLDFNAIQVTLAVMAQALIDGRIDCKTAGRLAVSLQTASNLLWVYHRGRRGTPREKALTTKDTKGHKEDSWDPIIVGIAAVEKPRKTTINIETGSGPRTLAQAA
jgi:hypothetical protein